MSCAGTAYTVTSSGPAKASEVHVGEPGVAFQPSLDVLAHGADASLTLGGAGTSTVHGNLRLDALSEHESSVELIAGSTLEVAAGVTLDAGPGSRWLGGIGTIDLDGTLAVSSPAAVLSGGLRAGPVAGTLHVDSTGQLHVAQGGELRLEATALVGTGPLAVAPPAQGVAWRQQGGSVDVAGHLTAAGPEDF